VSVVVLGGHAHRDIQAALARVPAVQSVGAPQDAVYRGKPVAIYTVALRGNPLSDRAMGELPGIRGAAVRALGSGTQVYVGGETADNAGTFAAVAHDTQVVIPLVLVLIMVLLMLYLRSLVAAVYLIATVILSFLAALGAGWLVLHDILGIAGWADGVTLYAFVFLVALGEDYNIFMLSAIWDRRRADGPEQAIRWGMQQSGPVIAAAGLILAGTFLVLTGLPLRILLEFGTVVAIGVLLDTFLVRGLLVPAVTRVLGDRAWWPQRPPAVPDLPR
jgi:RND superfamily putative drug exporter